MPFSPNLSLFIWCLMLLFLLFVVAFNAKQRMFCSIIVLRNTHNNSIRHRKLLELLVLLGLNLQRFKSYVIVHLKDHPNCRNTAVQPSSQYFPKDIQTAYSKCIWQSSKPRKCASCLICRGINRIETQRPLKDLSSILAVISLHNYIRDFRYNYNYFSYERTHKLHQKIFLLVLLKKVSYFKQKTPLFQESIMKALSSIVTIPTFQFNY